MVLLISINVPPGDLCGGCAYYRSSRRSKEKIARCMLFHAEVREIATESGTIFAATRLRECKDAERGATTVHKGPAQIAEAIIKVAEEDPRIKRELDLIAESLMFERTKADYRRGENQHELVRYR